MKQLSFYIISMFIFLASACKKIDVEPMGGTPVFAASFLLDGTAEITLNGGVDNYYMFTSFEQDGNHVFSFTGELKLENCDANCGESLEIKIRDIAQRPNGQVAIDDALNTGQYEYRSDELEIGNTVIDEDTFFINQINLIADPGQNNPATTTYNWYTNFGDSFPGAMPPPLELDTAGLFPEITLEVREDISGFSLCRSTQTQAITDAAQPACSVSIVPELLNDSLLISLAANAEGAAMPVSYLWSNGATTQSITNADSPGTYSVTISDSEECTSTASYFYDELPGVCQARFTYEAEAVVDSIITTVISIPGDSLQFARASIIYTSPEGEIFSSEKLDQPANSFFEILNVEDFDYNENGDPTKKLTLRFRCQLWNAEEEMKTIESILEAVIGVAYPR